jgi:hypothetical protein
MNSPTEISYEKYTPKSMKSHQDISQRPTKKLENLVRKLHTKKNVQHKASSRIRVRQEKEGRAHSQ